MHFRRIAIAAIAAAGFAFTATAAPVTQLAPINSESAVTLVGYHHHYRHHGHWGHHHHHHGVFCLFSLAPWCWR